MPKKKKKRKRKLKGKALKSALINLKKARRARLRNLHRHTKRTRKLPKRKNPGMKRRRESLTGGTGDVNPQYYSGIILQSGPDTTDAVQLVLPSPKFSVGQGKSVVLEILKIGSCIDTVPPFAAGYLLHEYVFSFWTKEPPLVLSAVSLGTPSCFYSRYYQTGGAFTALGSAWNAHEEVVWTDLTDGQGHGILIATDFFWIGLRTVNTAVATQFGWKILYRFKKVALQEYIGIVQSQQ